MRQILKLSYDLLIVGASVRAMAMTLQPQLYLASTHQPRFALGFHITASYGAAAIVHDNGTTTILPEIPANEEYNRMMVRLSLDSSRHPSPPYNNLGDSWSDMTRQAIRQARKAIGLPASADVGHLANMISALRSAVEEHLQTTIDSAGITTMHLAALYPEDLRDACEYARLAYLSFPMRYRLLYETITAYAGYGHGLCHDYRDREGCKREQDNMGWDVVMAVLFTPTVLTVTLSIAQSAYYLFEPDYRYYANFHLGYNSPARRENGVGYWNAVADQLEMIMRENPYYERPDKVLLMGDCVHDGDFRAALVEALSNQNSTPNILDHDAAYVAAKGAAELTRRLPWDPYDSKAAGFQAPTARSYGRLRLAEPAQQSDLAMSFRQPPKPVRETSEEDLLLRPHIH